MSERVVVGSGNPVKVAATRRVVDRLFEGSVTGEPVDSGVSGQPRGHEETLTGAENRARRALSAVPAASYGVGIEGGVATREGSDGDWLVMWAAVTDGETWGRAAGPSLRLPDAVAERVRAGGELGPVLDELLGEEGIGERGGAAGVLTDGAIDRESALAHAVAGAFGPFVSDL